MTDADLAPTGAGAAESVTVPALSFDDAGVAEWLTARDFFLAYSARVTFFVSRYARLDEERRAGVFQLANDGHAIEAHSVLHVLELRDSTTAGRSVSSTATRA